MQNRKIDDVVQHHVIHQQKFDGLIHMEMLRQSKLAPPKINSNQTA
jgi:hypothetical protein